MASQVRSKPPRPLSIIDESSFDENTGSDSPGSSAADADIRQRPARRISVAPLEHPIVALGGNHVSESEAHLREHSGNNSAGDMPDGQGNLREHSGKNRAGDMPNGQRNLRELSGKNRTNDVLDSNAYDAKREKTKDVLSHFTFNDDTESYVSNNESLRDRVSSESNLWSKYRQRIGDLLPLATVLDSSRVDVNKTVNNVNVNNSGQLTNSMLTTRSYKDLRKAIRESEEISSNVNSSEHEKRIHCLEKGSVAKENGVIKFSRVNVHKAEGYTDDRLSVDQQLEENDKFSKEQKAWRNKVIKSHSFTALPAKSRSLRRSLGSYDFKNPTFLARYGKTCLNPEGSMDTEDKSNTLVKFYLSSGVDLCADHDNEGNRRLESNTEDTVKHPNELLFRRNYSWNSLHKPLNHESLQHSANCNNHPSIEKSKSFPSLLKFGNMLINHQSQPTHSQSETRLSDSLRSKTTNNIHPGIRSYNPLVRRISAVDQSNFRSLEALATRLNLSTRRLSTTVWKDQFLPSQSIVTSSASLLDPRSRGEPGEDDKAKGRSTDGLLTEADRRRLEEMIASAREELINMRYQDEVLARQFLKIRRQIVEMRLVVQCQNHMQLLDVAQEDVEEMKELSRVVDFPPELLSPDQSLLHVGLTKMNLASRRFSTC